jgi:adenine-specific DNA-methyltransferase
MKSDRSSTGKSPRLGRPPLSEEERKVRVSLTMSRKTLQQIDNERGAQPRSRFVESVLESSKAYASVVPRAEMRLNGIVYTPPALADYVAERVVAFFLADVRQQMKKLPFGSIAPRRWRVLDPACGGGELLAAVWRNLTAKLTNCRDPSLVRQELVATELLCGVDNDRAAVLKSKRRLAQLGGTGWPSVLAPNVLNTNALFPFGRDFISGWQQARRRFDAEQGFDIVIANPPWGADVSGYRENLASGAFSMSQGQFDSADLFVELAASVVRPGGYIAYILPDSLFNLERTALRKLLLRDTAIRLIARLGERIFDGINRACAVIICKRKSGNARARVRCFRLLPGIRRDILAGQLTFREAEERSAHLVPQSRFLETPEALFDIDVKESERRTLSRFREAGSSFRELLTSDRGVELSKKGRISQCRRCSLWMARPTASEPTCAHCGAKLDISAKNVGCIVSSEKRRGYVPLLVGETVRRYSLGEPLWIDPKKKGIKYKEPAIYAGPKLLFRKTGVGISAALDHSCAMTNQVVYIFRQKDRIAAEVGLEFFLGVANSRAMYYYLTKRHGETEWRSHPYVTQKQILDLPLPPLGVLTGEKRTAVREIVRLLRRGARSGRPISTDVDARVERLVAEVFNLGIEDYRAIYETLDSVQELLPVRALKNVEIGDVFAGGL